MGEIAFANGYSGYSNLPAIELAEKLVSLTYPNLDAVFFANSGSEANEVAFKLARFYWYLKGHMDKVKIIARRQAYHGGTLATTAATGIAPFWRGFGPLDPTILRAGPEHPFTPCGVECAIAIEDTITREGPDTVAAVIAEPVQGAGGIIPPEPGYFPKLREICDRHGVLLIADEVITGFGRTGRWFAVEHDNVLPDLMSVAKGITSGYVPLSASIARRKLSEVFADDTKEENVHPNTYAAHPVACAAALANLQIMEKDRLVENADAMGTRLLEGLRGALRSSKIVGEVRGRGLLVCAELVEPNDSGRPLDKSLVASLDRKAWDRGAIVYARGSVLRLAPPLCIAPGEVDQLVDVVAASIKDLEADVTR
jgi:putrescine aminotransferase